jgi:hypothetical protein
MCTLVGRRVPLKIPDRPPSLLAGNRAEIIELSRPVHDWGVVLYGSGEVVMGHGEAILAQGWSFLSTVTILAQVGRRMAETKVESDRSEDEKAKE